MTYKVKRKALGARTLPPLLDELATFVGTQAHGSLGWFDGVILEPLAGTAMPAKLVADGVVFAWLPDGERVVVIPQGAVVLVSPDGSARLVAPSLEGFALAWAKGATGVTAFDHDGSLLVERHGRGAASTRSVPSARKALGAWLKNHAIRAPKTTFDLDAYLGTAPRPQFDGAIPAASKQVHHALIAGKRTAWAAYGKELAKVGHPLAAVVLADVAAMAEPRGKRALKQAAKATFQTYVKAHLAPRYARLAGNMTHWTEPTFPQGLGFRYGFLDDLDSFGWTAGMVKQARAFLDDDHARWARDLTPRGMTFDDLAVFGTFPALRRLNFWWSKIGGVTSLAPLANARALVGLRLTGGGFDDLAPLGKLPLAHLYIDKTRVTDLSPLAKHPTLECLEASNTEITNVKPLFGSPHLVHVGIYDTKVSAADAQALVDAIQRTKPKATHPEYTLSGYSRGVSHHDVMWVT